MNKFGNYREIKTIYFPLTANPVGYNHLLLAENILWDLPKTQMIVFLISNGYHPDPLKRKNLPNSILRLEILKSAIIDWGNPEKSLPAKIASKSRIDLKLNENNSSISRSELSLKRPVHLFENIKSISKSKKAKILVGADLIERMLDPKIFSKKELEIISSESELQIVPRNKIELESILEKLKKYRGITISFKLIKSTKLPKNLQKFFLISSTNIRKAVQAGHNLKSFLPATAGEKIINCSLYKNIIISEHKFKYNELNLRCFELMEKLEYSAKLLLKILKELKNKKKPHKFSVLETSTGGKISESFTSLPGASNHFIVGKILYSKDSQKKFLSKNSNPWSSVSEKMAKELAEKMRKNSKTDWALAETGMLGPPSMEKRSFKNGQCHLGLSLNEEVKYKFIEFNPFLTRKEHQLLISIEAINWINKILLK